MEKMKLAVVALAMAGVTACGDRKEQCLPDGEKGTVLRTGSYEGLRYVTIKRGNGEEVTCSGKNTPVILQEGDKVDGSTLTKTSATKKGD